jgi:DNA helicase HerA-like ATPase
MAGAAPRWSRRDGSGPEASGRASPGTFRVREGSPPGEPYAAQRAKRYVGTLVGESTSKEFRLALAQEAVREQDIIAVDAQLRPTDDERSDGTVQDIRVWAKVQRIERINPLFPAEAGHELAATRTDPFDTVLSLSREMVTAVCQVLGAEADHGGSGGKLDHVRYPPQPASSAYRPDSEDIKRVVLGELQTKQGRALDIATLSNRPEVAVQVDGHAIVTRHLAILAMTGAGKSWTSRRIIEELAAKHYPMVIFDPHGDYTGLADVPALRKNVHRYYAQFPVFEEDADTVAGIVSALGYELSPTMLTLFPEVFQAARDFFDPEAPDMDERVAWLAGRLNRPQVQQFGLKRDMWLVAYLAEAAHLMLRDNDQVGRRRLQDWGWSSIAGYSGRTRDTLEGISRRTFKTAAALTRMERTNQRVAASAEPLPLDRTALVRYGTISVVSLAGYTADFQATIYSLIAESIFDARVRDDLHLPVLLVLEEAHNVAPANAATAAEQRAISTTRQIAQEGRKFGVGLVLISQRPSRLDETTLSQCNSYVIMRMVNPADQAFVRRVIETLGEEEASLLPDLDVGEALLSGQLINFPVLVRIKEPQSKGEREEQDAFAALEAIHRNLGPAAG